MSLCDTCACLKIFISNGLFVHLDLLALAWPDLDLSSSPGQQRMTRQRLYLTTITI
jgi:hypothetical protein